MHKNLHISHIMKIEVSNDACKFTKGWLIRLLSIKVVDSVCTEVPYFSLSPKNKKSGNFDSFLI